MCLKTFTPLEECGKYNVAFELVSKTHCDQEFCPLLGRTTLPVAQFSRGDFSLWSVLKNCVGKELSKITMPVVFNEPLSFLQRMLEYLEYAHLLRMASEQSDPVARMEYIAGKRQRATPKSAAPI